jgi:type III restriction enzyme
MSKKISLVEIFENDLLTGIRNTGHSDKIKPIPSYITENLKYTPHDFQAEAVENFIFYLESEINPVTQKDFRTDRNKPVHLMFNMATGSGKTLVMAANILYLLNQGFKKILFITHQSNILNKTKENLTNVHHQKYLFTPEINLNSKLINLREVKKFTNTDNYEIKYTTIHKLHRELSPKNIRENVNTQDELNKLKIAILADEAHHFNVETNKIKSKDKDIETSEDSKPEVIYYNWEKTIIDKVLNKNYLDTENNNILLEYTATVPDSKKMEEKYLDKIIYKFDLRSFMSAKLTKEINLVTHTLQPKEKIIYALAFNWYRHKIALKNNIPNFKPVTLFRRKTITESKEDFEFFFDVVENLEVDDLSFFDIDIPKTSNTSSIHEQGISRTKQIVELLTTDSSKNEFIQFVKNNFKKNINVVITNSELNKKKTKENIDENLEQQLNNLEDPNNNIRAIFTVQRLTEGWDVQNLYDIVRMDTSQNEGGMTKKTPEATIQEKQLIGRAVRFNPYKIKNETFRNRQHDDNLDSELRILEEFFYFTYDEENKYISELKKELRKEGYISERNEIVKFDLKKKFKKNNFYKTGFLWANSQIDGKELYLKKIDELDLIVDVTIPNNTINEERLQSDLSTLQSNEFTGDSQLLKCKIKDFENHVILKSLYRTRKSFNELKQLFNIETFDNLNENKVFENFLIEIISSHKDLSTMNGSEKLYVLDQFFEKLIAELTTLLKRKYGEKSFSPILLSEFFGTPKEKSIDMDVDNNEKDRIFKMVAEEPWYVSEAFKKESNEKLMFLSLTSEELSFLELFKQKLVPKVQDISEEFYLIRNEEQLKLFDFETGKGFDPDFLLFIKLKENLIYLLFIEPKGMKDGVPLFDDQWKEEFLIAIDSLHGLSGEKLKVENTKYNLIGLPFYNSKQEEVFTGSFEKILF